MSIEFSPAFDSGRSSLSVSRGMGASREAPMQSPRPAAPAKKRLKPRTHGRGARGAHATNATSSPRRLAANRRNAQRSTGPRTAAGKKRASRNAIKHGLCSKRATLPGECSATYATFVREIEEELQPRTALQHSLVPHIANLIWRIDRMPQAQAEIFQLELEKCASGEELSASTILARRFSDEPARNGFLLIGRYERGLHNQLLRLMSRYDALKRHRPTAPGSADEPPVPDERTKPAWTDEMMQKQIDAFARRTRAIDEGDTPPASDYERTIDACIRLTREHKAACEKRTQSNPPENPPGDAGSAKCAFPDASPPAKRTHCGLPPTAAACHSRALPLASSAPKIHGDSDAIRDEK